MYLSAEADRKTRLNNMHYISKQNFDADSDIYWNSAFTKILASYKNNN